MRGSTVLSAKRNDLELYARVEHLLGIEESTQFLHDSYAQTLEAYDVKSVLDIGCGRGGLMEQLAFDEIEAKGIDLSEVMVEDAKAKGLNAECIDIADEKGQYDAAVAVFDVLNFMDADALDAFLDNVAKVLKPKGLFIADINTQYGFSAVAEGTMNAEDEDGFLSVDAVYDKGELRTIFTYFEKAEEACYTKEQQMITQYFHPLSFFRRKRALKLIKHEKISLYDKDDKALLIFSKES
jgi:2-polyprenyl-3-methyl-5-hydroxy-6-metoxy-1,4-benzoquinol methylase